MRINYSSLFLSFVLLVGLTTIGCQTVKEKIASPLLPASPPLPKSFLVINQQLPKQPSSVIFWFETGVGDIGWYLVDESNDLKSWHTVAGYPPDGQNHYYTNSNPQLEVYYRARLILPWDK